MRKVGIGDRIAALALLVFVLPSLLVIGVAVGGPGWPIERERTVAGPLFRFREGGGPISACVRLAGMTYAPALANVVAGEVRLAAVLRTFFDPAS